MPALSIRSWFVLLIRFKKTEGLLKDYGTAWKCSLIYWRKECSLWRSDPYNWTCLLKLKYQVCSPPFPQSNRRKKYHWTRIISCFWSSITSLPWQKAMSLQNYSNAAVLEVLWRRTWKETFTDASGWSTIWHLWNWWMTQLACLFHPTYPWLRKRWSGRKKAFKMFIPATIAYSNSLKRSSERMRTTMSWLSCSL